MAHDKAFDAVFNLKAAKETYNKILGQIKRFDKPCPVKVKGPDRVLVEIISDNILDDERIELTQRLLWAEKFRELLDSLVKQKSQVEIYLKGHNMTRDEIMNGFDMVGPVQGQLI